MRNINDKAPAGATHRYEHANNVDWYLQAEHGLYRWQQGSWCASVYKAVQDLVNSCPLGRLEAIPAMPAQPADDDLTWLVRETKGEWFDNSTHITREGMDDYLWAPGPIQSARYPECHWFTKEQYLARRAELQNKPSWDEAGSEYTHLVQTADGSWAFTVDPEIRCGKVLSDSFDFLGPEGFKGEVLGDWRDTLERRPADSITIDWSTAPEGATHHIRGNNLEFSWHKNGSRIKYWNGFVWIKRSGFHTIDEARAKGCAVVARPADLSEPAVTKRLDEATQNVLAAVPELMDEKYSFEPEFKPVTVTNETVQLERPVAVAGTGNGSASESAFLIGRVIDLLRTSVDHFSANELADLHQLCDSELTKRDAAVCGGQKYLDANWFERGELPPVGARVQWRPGSAGQWEHDSWIDVDVIAHAGDGDIVIKWDGEVGNNKQLVAASQETFRPIRTERNQLTTLLTQAGITTCVDQAADAILAAGFKRGDA